MNWAPLKVWPKDQPRGAALLETTERPSPVVTRKERAWPSRSALLCQFWPQFRDMGSHPVLELFTLARTMSPAPATLVMSTRLK